MKDNLEPWNKLYYSAYLITDEGEILASRDNEMNILLPPLFEGYVIMELSQFRNSWVDGWESNVIDLSRTSIKKIGVNIKAEGVSLPTYISFDNFFICGAGVSHKPGDIAETGLEASMFYGLDINKLENVNSDSYRAKHPVNSEPAEVESPSASSSTAAETSKNTANTPKPTSAATPKATPQPTPTSLPTSQLQMTPDCTSDVPAGFGVMPSSDVTAEAEQTAASNVDDVPEIEEKQGVESHSFSRAAGQALNGGKGQQVQAAADINVMAEPAEISEFEIKEGTSNGGFPIWGWIIAAAAGSGIIAATVLVVLKKNKGAKH